MPELQVSDIPDVRADCVFSHVTFLGPLARGRGLWSWDAPGRKISRWDALSLGRRRRAWKSWARGTVEFTPSWESGGGERALAT